MKLVFSQKNLAEISKQVNLFVVVDFGVMQNINCLKVDPIKHTNQTHMKQITKHTHSERKRVCEKTESLARSI